MVKLPKRFSVGERVFAKVRGYPPWPAKIQSISEANTKNAKYHVLFYGTQETGTCKIEDLYQYAENKEKFSKAQKRKPFRDGLLELEEDLKKNPDPATESSKDPEAAENVPENVDVSEKTSETHHMVITSADNDGDSGNLVIDEGDKKKAMKRKSQVVNTPDVTEVKKKRGRKSMATILAESTPKQQESAHDSQDEDSEKKVVSRSGRKIKPKRFHDYSDAEVSSDQPKNDQITRNRTKSKNEDANESHDTPVAPIKKRLSVERKASTEEVGAEGGRSSVQPEPEEVNARPGTPAAAGEYTGRLLVARTRAGLQVGIKLDVDRPDRFESEAARARWDLSVARNAMRLKEQLESGAISPELVRESLEFDVHVPEDEKKTSLVKQGKNDANDPQFQLRLKCLRIESQIIFLDTQIRSSLGLDQANTDECLEAFDQILELEITPLILKKHSHIVETVKRLRRYVGNLKDWKLSEEETIIFKQKAEQIQKKAEVIYDKFKKLFSYPQDQTFWEYFTEQIELFKQATKDMTQEEIFNLLVDPTESMKPIKTEVTKTEPKTVIENEEPVASTSSKDTDPTESETK